MSTGGAPTKAMMKQMVAASSAKGSSEAEPTDIETVVSAGNPITKRIQLDTRAWQTELAILEIVSHQGNGDYFSAPKRIMRDVI